MSTLATSISSQSFLHFLFFFFTHFENSDALCLSLAAPPARDVFQQLAPGASPVERRGVDDSAAENDGDGEEGSVVDFGRRRLLTILHCCSPLELRPARLFYPPCVSVRPLAKRWSAKGKLARRGGELYVAGKRKMVNKKTPTELDALLLSSSLILLLLSLRFPSTSFSIFTGHPPAGSRRKEGRAGPALLFAQREDCLLGKKSE